MTSKFSAVVTGQGENSIPIGLQIITDCICDSPRCFIGSHGGNGKSRLPLNKRHKDWVPLFADHSICFLIPNTVAQVNYVRAFLNGYSILDLAAALSTAIALAPLFLTSQVGVKLATVTLVCIDMLVDPFRADAWLTNVFQMTCDLLGAQFFADHFFNPSPRRIRDTGPANLCLPCTSQTMRLLWSISTQNCVALKLTANRRFVDTSLVCDGALRQTSFIPRIKLVTLTLSEAVISSHSCSITLDGETLGHRCLMHHIVGEIALQS